MASTFLKNRDRKRNAQYPAVHNLQRALSICDQVTQPLVSSSDSSVSCNQGRHLTAKLPQLCELRLKFLLASW